MKPMPLHLLAKWIGLSHPSKTLIHGFAIDSRKVKDGDFFFALPGKRTDGHTFLKDVKEKGAIGACVSKDYRGDDFGLELLVVADVVAALQEMARKALFFRSCSVVAITGSIGKTTTKEFAKTLLSSKFRVFSSPLSYNSKLTVPLTILNADEEAEILLLEMGTTEKGDLENLISIAPPDVALITTVALQHAIHFPDGLFGIAKEKASIFSHPKTQTGFLFREMPFYEEALKVGKCKKQCFSLIDKEADYYLEFISEGVRLFFKKELVLELTLTLPLKVYFQNFLAAVTLAHFFDIPWEVIGNAAKHLQLPPMRFEKVERQGITFINDAYNANPDSMKAALESLPKPLSSGKTIAVISEMDALGMYSEAGHLLVAEAALQNVDILLCLGERCEIIKKVWKKEKKNIELFETRDLLVTKLKEMVQPGDVVLLKGARAYALDQVLNAFE